MGPTHGAPPSYEGVLCTCAVVVKLIFFKKKKKLKRCKIQRGKMSIKLIYVCGCGCGFGCVCSRAKGSTVYTREMTYILTTWHTVPLEKEQSQVRLFSFDPCVGSTHPDCRLHGSTLKFQSVFPKLFAMSCKASTAKVIAQINTSDQISYN